MLRRYTYAGIKFQEERGWYRVEKPVAEYLRAVREVPSDRHSPPAFDVCTEAEAKVLESTETEASRVKRSATDDLKVVAARPAGALTTDDLPKTAAAPAAKDDEKDARRGKRERE